MHISEIVDEVVESIDRPSINARGVAEGTARGLLRDLLTYEEVRPEEYRQAWRQLVSLVGREEAHALLTAGRDAVARRSARG